MTKDVFFTLRLTPVQRAALRNLATMRSCSEGAAMRSILDALLVGRNAATTPTKTAKIDNGAAVSEAPGAAVQPTPAP